MSDALTVQLIWATVLAVIAGAVVWLIKRAQDASAKNIEDSLRKLLVDMDKFRLQLLQQDRRNAEAEHDVLTKVDVGLGSLRKELDALGEVLTNRISSAVRALDGMSLHDAERDKRIAFLEGGMSQLADLSKRFDNVLLNTETARVEFQQFKDKTEKVVVETHKALDAAVAEVKTHTAAAARLGQMPSNVGMPRFRP